MRFQWRMLHPSITPDHLGFLPSTILQDDPRPVREQIGDRYAHGGGCRAHDPKWRLNPETMSLKYPGDPAMLPLASCKINDELVFFYDCAILLILQPDGSFHVMRVD